METLVNWLSSLEWSAGHIVGIVIFLIYLLVHGKFL